MTQLTLPGVAYVNWRPAVLTHGHNLAEAGKALALANSGDWPEKILVEARVWFKARAGQRVTIEQFRQDAQNKPASHKAWGGIVRLFVREGLIRPASHADGSPLMTPAGSLKTHGHFVRVYDCYA